MSDIVKRLRERAGHYDEYGWHDEIEREAADTIEQLRKSLARCLKEAEYLLDESHGCKPSEVMDYDGWADEARRLLVVPDEPGTIKEEL
jgi:hypothetical protein